MNFLNRYDAGKKLVPHLSKYQDNPDAIVLGLPRGGVVTASEVAKGLNLPLDIIYPRKIGAPYNPEFAIGAISETGERLLDKETIQRLDISKEYIDQIVEKEKAVAQARLKSFRKDKPPRNLKGKIVILVDDGLATGSTMRVAIKSAKAEGAAKIVVAVPVSPPDTLARIEQEVDEAVCLRVPPYFSAVGEFYEDFRQTDDEEVIELLQS